VQLQQVIIGYKEIKIQLVQIQTVSSIIPYKTGYNNLQFVTRICKKGLRIVILSPHRYHDLLSLTCFNTFLVAHDTPKIFFSSTIPLTIIQQHTSLDIHTFKKKESDNSNFPTNCLHVCSSLIIIKFPPLLFVDFALTNQMSHPYFGITLWDP